MAKRIYKAKDKLVQRRFRGVTVVENVRTKKRRRIGKKDAELDVNMARVPTDRFRLPDDEPEAETGKARRIKAGKRDNRYDRVPDEDAPSRPKRMKRMPWEHGNARRLKYEEEELRLQEEAPESFEIDSFISPETGEKARQQRPVQPGNGITPEDDSEAPIEGLEVSPDDGESPSPTEHRQRQRKHASAFREEKARKEAASENFGDPSGAETTRKENPASVKRKSRLNFSDEGYGFANGIGRIGKHAVKASVVPAMAYTRQELREASKENEGVHHHRIRQARRGHAGTRRR